MLATDLTSVNLQDLNSLPKVYRNVYTTSTNILTCTMFMKPFTINLPVLGTQQFKCLAVLSKVVNGEKTCLGLFVGNNCDEMANDLYANADVIYLRRSAGYTMAINSQTGILFMSSIFTPSQWQKAR